MILIFLRRPNLRPFLGQVLGHAANSGPLLYAWMPLPACVIRGRANAWSNRAVPGMRVTGMVGRWFLTLIAMNALNIGRRPCVAGRATSVPRNRAYGGLLAIAR